MQAEKLRMRVREAEKTKVDLAFKAQVVQDLRDLMPDYLHPVLEQRSIGLDPIAENVLKNDFAPGGLFQLDTGAKTARCGWSNRATAHSRCAERNIVKVVTSCRPSPQKKEPCHAGPRC